MPSNRSCAQTFTVLAPASVGTLYALGFFRPSTLSGCREQHHSGLSWCSMAPRRCCVRVARKSGAVRGLSLEQPAFLPHSTGPQLVTHQSAPALNSEKVLHVDGTCNEHGCYATTPMSSPLMTLATAKFGWSFAMAVPTPSLPWEPGSIFVLFAMRVLSTTDGIVSSAMQT